MLLDLNKLHGQREHFERTFQPSAFDPQDERLPGRRAGRADRWTSRRPAADAFRVTGRVDDQLELECGRCLEPFEVPVDAAFDLRYVPAGRERRRRGTRDRAKTI